MAGVAAGGDGAAVMDDDRAEIERERIAGPVDDAGQVVAGPQRAGVRPVDADDALLRVDDGDMAGLDDVSVTVADAVFAVHWTQGYRAMRSHSRWQARHSVMPSWTSMPGRT